MNGVTRRCEKIGDCHKRRGKLSWNQHSVSSAVVFTASSPSFEGSSFTETSRRRFSTPPPYKAECRGYFAGSRVAGKVKPKKIITRSYPLTLPIEFGVPTVIPTLPGLLGTMRRFAAPLHRLWGPQLIE